MIIEIMIYMGKHKIINFIFNLCIMQSVYCDLKSKENVVYSRLWLQSRHMFFNILIQSVITLIPKSFAALNFRTENCPNVCSAETFGETFFLLISAKHLCFS